MTASPSTAGARTPADLRVVLDLAAPRLHAAAGRLQTAEHPLESYLDWLRISYDMIRATAPLLAEAARECLRRDDPVSAQLTPFFAHQIAAEHGHDRWVLEDYTATGRDAAELTGRVASADVARLVGAQYYWVRHAHPVALVGHIAVLEWYPPSPELPRSLAARTGLPPAAFRTLARHAELDIGHGLELAELLAVLRLGDRDHRVMVTSALGTLGALIDLMTTIAGPSTHDGTRQIP